MDRDPHSGPFRAFRDRYAAPFAGLSYDLAPRAVGVHPGHLARVPELAGRDVLVSHESAKPASLSSRPAFHIVELTAMMRDALGAARYGVVFSVFALEEPAAGRLLAPLARGDGVFLNTAIQRLPGDIVRRPDVAS